MKKSIDSKAIVRKIKDEGKRSKVSFTLDSAVYESFQDACKSETVSASRVIEECMREFSDGVKIKKPKD